MAVCRKELRQTSYSHLGGQVETRARAAGLPSSGFVSGLHEPLPTTNGGTGMIRPTVMRSTIVTLSTMAAGGLLLATVALAAEPQPVWEAKGLDAPKSALPDPGAGVIYVSTTASRSMPTATATSPSCPPTARSSTSTG